MDFVQEKHFQDHHDLGRSFVKQLDESNITNVRRIFSSQPTLNASHLGELKKVSSEPDLHYKADYDDLCGPWIYPENPIYETYDEPFTPRLCTWIFIHQRDIAFVRENQNDKDKMLFLFEYKLPHLEIFIQGTNRKLFLALMWQVFTFCRNNDFTEQGVAASLGIFFLTHRFFVAQLQRTAEDVYNFFLQSLLIHSIMDPPKSDEVFSLRECELLLDFFCKIYLQQLPLIRSVFLPNYKLLLNI